MKYRYFFPAIFIMSFFLSCPTNWHAIISAATLDNQARLYYSLGNYKQTENFLLEALELRKALLPAGKHPDYYYTLNDLAWFYYTIGNYGKAEPLLLEAAEIIKFIPAQEEAPAVTLYQLASVYVSLGNYSKAESLFLKALEITRSLPPANKNPDYAANLNSLAEVYVLVGDYAKAEPLYQRALAIRKKIFPAGKHPVYAATLDDLAGLYAASGHSGAAESLYLRALEIRKSRPPAGKHYTYAVTLNNLALLYKAAGNYSKAEPLLQQSLGITKSLLPAGKHPDYANALHNLAGLYELMGNYSQAETCFIESLSISREFLRSNFAALSEQEKEKLIDTIAPRFHDFFSFMEKRLPANPALACTAADFQLFRKAILFRSVKKMRTRILQSTDKELKKNFDNWLMLRRQINKSFELTEEQWQNQSHYPSRETQLMHTAEKIREEARKNDNKELPDDFDNWHLLYEQINEIIKPGQASKQSADTAAGEAEANRLEKKLSAQSEDFRLAYEQQEYTWQDIRAVLKPGEAAVEMIRYLSYNNNNEAVVHYAAVIIEPGSVQPEIRFLENGSTLEAEIIHLYRNFMGETAHNVFARQDTGVYNILYTFLWKPLAVDPDKVKRIFFSPDGIYHFINPGTLQDADGSWLSDKWEIVRITSLQDIMEQDIMEKKQQADAEVHPPVLVGYPDYDLDSTARQLLVNKLFPGAGAPDYESITCRDGSTLQPLPGTREEVNAIACFYREKGEKPVVWLGEAALEENIKSVDNPSVLHLATHAFFQEDVKKREGLLPPGADAKRLAEDPLLCSGLLFSGAGCALNGCEVQAELENGILTAREAADLQLERTELVVLSACDTGLGKIKNGEGVYGLQRAFLVAGADAVLMSLWKVGDTAVRDFMVEFYSHWLAGCNKQDAYRKTVAWMKTKYPAPFYWGAFVLIGG